MHLTFVGVLGSVCGSNSNSVAWEEILIAYQYNFSLEKEKKMNENGTKMYSNII